MSTLSIVVLYWAEGTATPTAECYRARHIHIVDEEPVIRDPSDVLEWATIRDKRVAEYVAYLTMHKQNSSFHTFCEHGIIVRSRCQHQGEHDSKMLSAG